MQGRFLTAALAALSVMLAPAPARSQPATNETCQHSAAAHSGQVYANAPRGSGMAQAAGPAA